MLNKLRKAWIYKNQNGWPALARTILVRLRMNKHQHPFSKINVISQYDGLLDLPFGKVVDESDVSSKTINWFIPPVGKGSGGHLNIFRFMRHLENLGFDNRIIIVGSPQPFSATIAKQEIEEWFFPLKAAVYLEVTEDTPASYFAMATSWPTAYYVRRFMGCVKKCYFVQDFEPWFYPSGTDALLAEDTYRFGFHGITAGSWLSEKLAHEYGMKTFPLGFSFDKELYKPPQKEIKKENVRRVLFYARPPTARRAFELGLLVLREVCKKHPDVRVVMAGWDVTGYEIPFPCEHAGLMELDQLPNLYAKCDAALVLSCSNLSLLPLELMACGVPVISNRAPYTQWLLTEDNSMLAEPDIMSLALAVEEVLQNEVTKNRLKKEGLKFAKNTSWEEEAKRFANQLTVISSEIN